MTSIPEVPCHDFKRHAASRRGRCPLAASRGLLGSALPLISRNADNSAPSSPNSNMIKGSGRTFLLHYYFLPFFIFELPGTLPRVKDFISEILDGLPEL